MKNMAKRWIACALCLALCLGFALAEGGAAVLAVSVTTERLVLRLGEVQKIEAAVIPAGAREPALLYTSEDPSVAYMTGAYVRGISPGETRITVSSAENASLMGFCQVTVLADTTIGMNPASLSLQVSDTQLLFPRVLPGEIADQGLTFESDDPAVCTVSATGRVTAVGTGYTSVRAIAADGVTGTCPVFVGRPADAIALSSEALSLTAGSGAQLTAVILPEEADGRLIAWSSDQPQVARVDDNGYVTALMAGDALITAAARDGSGAEASCAVHVESDGMPETTPDSGLSRTAYVNAPQGVLNMRATPTAEARVVRRIPQDAPFTVLAYGDTWCLAQYAGVTGYVMTEYVLLEEPVQAEPAPPAAQSGDLARVTVDHGSVNLRAGASRDTQRLRLIPGGETVEILTYGSEWCQVRYGESTGYMMTQYLALSPTPAYTGPEGPALAWVFTERGGLNLRSAPSTDAAILQVIPRDAQVQVLEQGVKWCYVRYNNLQGYVKTEYLAME